MKKRSFWLMFLFILSVAVFLRFFKLGSIPVSLYWDEIAMLLDSKVLAQTGRDMHGSSFFQSLFLSYGDYKLPIYIWLATLSVKILGVSELALRLPSAIAGIGTILITGFIAKNLFNLKDKNTITGKKSTLLLFLSTLLVVTLSPWSITFSRTAFEGHIGQLLVAISILHLIKSNKKNSFNFLSAIIGALATYAYFSVRFVWPVIFIAFSLIEKTKKTKKWYFSKISSLILFAILLIPMINSPFYKDSNRFRLSTTSILNKQDWPVVANQYREIAGNKFIDRVIFNRYTLIGRELLINYSDHLSLNYLFVNGDSNLRHGTGEHGLFLLIFMPIFFIGVYQLSKNHKPELFVLIVWWMIALLPASVPETTPHALRSLNALVPISLIIGFGLFQFIKWSFYSKKIINKILLGVFTIILFISTVEFSYYYFYVYPTLSASSWQNNYKELALSLEKEKDPVRYVWLEPFDDRFYLWSLTYGDYTGKEIQKIIGDQHKPQQVENIKFIPFDWDKLNTLEHKIIVAGKKSNIEQNLNKIKINHTFKKIVGNHHQPNEFLVVGLGE